jgi:tRNA (guanine-N7-)-methyltransferase
MVNPENLKVFHRILKPRGRLQIASDHPVYVPWVLMCVMKAGGLFRWTAEKSKDFSAPPADWLPTRYEGKARAAGRTPVYINLEKIS